MFHGTTANTEVNRHGVNASASIKKVVIIKEEGEKLSFNLKKDTILRIKYL